MNQHNASRATIEGSLDERPQSSGYFRADPMGDALVGQVLAQLADQDYMQLLVRQFAEPRNQRRQ